MTETPLQRLLRDQEAIDELLDKVRSNDPGPVAQMLAADGGNGDGLQLERLIEQHKVRLESTATTTSTPESAHLEAVVRLHARPSLLVQDNRIQLAASETWQRRLKPHQRTLSDRILSVGRVDVCGHDRFDWVGTAWVVGDNLAITNRHVVEEFGRNDDGTWSMACSVGQGPMQAEIDFLAEDGKPLANKVRVESIQWVWHGPGPSADLALLELAGDNLPAPITLSDRDPELDQFVTVVGYPARDSRNEEEALARIFDNKYGVKRAAPGQITGRGDSIRFEHDCSTLGGNSGSVVLDLESGAAVGLHFGGTYRKANFAVRASVVRQALDRAGAYRSKSKPVAASPQEGSAAGNGSHQPAAAALREAVQSSKRTVDEAFETVLNRISAGSIPVAEAREILHTLRDAGEHRRVIETGERLVQADNPHPLLRRLLAQGLIEVGRIADAIAQLESADRDLQDRLGKADEEHHAAAALWVRNEQAEVHGLFGRAYKQSYIDALPTAKDPRTAAAEKASGYYEQVYRSSPVRHLWHGINVVALRCHQHRLVDSSSDCDPIAEEIAIDVLRNLEVLEEIGDLTAWDYATRAEALLALERDDEFARALDEWLARPDLTRFMVESFARQLQQIWRIAADDGPGSAVLAKLEQKLQNLGEAQRAIGKSPREPATTKQAAPAKARLAAESADNRASRRARGVAKLGRSFFDGSGSGFLIDPVSIWPDYQGPRNLFLLTNAHVCCPDADPFSEAPLHPRAARFAFLGPKGKVDRNILVAHAEPLWSSPPDELDATLLLLDGGPTAEPFPLVEQPIAPGEQANIVGYPLGGGLWFSSESNVVQEVDSRHLLYTTKTEPGMSGSPVFDADWQLIAMHRHSQSDRQLNGGVRIDRLLPAIREALQAKFGNRGPDPYLDPR